MIKNYDSLKCTSLQRCSWIQKIQQIKLKKKITKALKQL